MEILLQSLSLEPVFDEHHLIGKREGVSVADHLCGDVGEENVLLHLFTRKASLSSRVALHAKKSEWILGKGALFSPCMHGVVLELTGQFREVDPILSLGKEGIERGDQSGAAAEIGIEKCDALFTKSLFGL